MRSHTSKRLALTVAIFLALIAMSASAHAISLRQGSTGGSGAVTGSLPGEVLWTYYETAVFSDIVCPAGTAAGAFLDGCNSSGRGDNILRLINPNGAANGNLAGAKSQTVCAMIYVFDEDEEMGECCGCPLSSSQLATFSLDQNLNSNWGINSPEGGFEGVGALAIVAASPNAPISFQPGLSNGRGCVGTQSGACNFGCDPTNTPGYSVTASNNLLGSITHNQSVAQQLEPGFISVSSGITETALSDDAGGDPTNLTYLQTQCGALVGNGTGGGICNCPIE